MEPGTPPASNRGVTRRRVWRGGATESVEDDIAVEEPLEIRVAGEPVAVTMRTPGNDLALVAGFLFAEGIITSLEDLASIAPCGRTDEEGYGNVVDAVAAPGVRLVLERAEAQRRGTLTTTACGVCGRRSIDDLLALCAPLGDAPLVATSVVSQALAQLREGQAVFGRTGGTHAAAAFSATGAKLAEHEDVGRHNAIDKVVGALLYSKRLNTKSPSHTEAPMVLAVSGRASFEVVQKAAVARIPVVASVSAPSSLAVDLAERVGIALAGFVRGDAFNVYTHPERLTS
jgi:FdhD protein